MTLDECEKIYDKALASNSEAEFCHAIEPLFREYEILSLVLGRSAIYWRARIIEDNSFVNIAELDYPPPECARQGRLNDHGIPYFYIAAREETAIAEVGADAGQMIQLAGFRVINESPVRLAVIGEYSNVQKNGYSHFAGQDPDLTITKMLNLLPKDEALKMIYIDRFFAHILSDPDAGANGYIYSRALARSILSRNESDGVAFPSVKDRGGFNLGLEAEASDRCFHKVCCVVAKVIAKRRFGLIDYSVVNSAEYLDEEGNFVWHEKFSPGIMGFYNMSKEEFEIASRDPNNKNSILDILHPSRR